MSRRKSLGKGLDALIPTEQEAPAAGETVRELDIDSIRPNPRQPRRDFDPDQLQALANSIAEHGVLQPLVVAGSIEDVPAILIAGQRRLEAAKLAGLATVPVVFREANEQQLLELALIENLQREDLNAIEAALGYQQLADDFDLSHEQIAERVGKSRSAVTNTVRLLNSSQTVQDAIVDGKVSEGHGRALLGLTTDEAQAAALQTVVGKSLSVRQTEELVRKLAGERRTKKPAPKRSPEEAALENELQETLGTRVNLKRSRRGGTITLHFYSDEELETLVSRLTGRPD